ncbi:hypothetical protein ACTVCO_09860 [Sanguibacter sp. A247]|uniref:hypothetical protein n=1 Tax=unclassified Sanguibacter TaxID=2645534 RepID=UPI003FD810F3
MGRLAGVAAALVLGALSVAGGAPAGAAPTVGHVVAAPAAAPRGVALATSDACPGVAIVVDLGDLPVTDPQRGSFVHCEPTTGPALDVLRVANVELEGTVQMGLAFVCRVEGRPAADESIRLADGSTRTEPCRRTPPATSYWSLWQAGDDGAWRYATAGIGDIDLAAGSALALVYSVERAQGRTPAVSVAHARAGDVPNGWTLREPAAGTALPDGGPEPVVLVGLGVLAALAVGVVVVRVRRSRG